MHTTVGGVPAESSSVSRWQQVVLALIVGSFVVLTVLSFPGSAGAWYQPGNISLKVKGTCTSPGDSIREFYVWTPQRGKKRVTSGKSATLNIGTFRKSNWGDTYFNWKLTCRMAGSSGERQKRYGGGWGSGFSYSVENFYGRIKNP